MESKCNKLTADVTSIGLEADLATAANQKLQNEINEMLFEKQRLLVGNF